MYRHKGYEEYLKHYKEGDPERFNGIYVQHYKEGDPEWFNGIYVQAFIYGIEEEPDWFKEGISSKYIVARNKANTRLVIKDPIGHECLVCHGDYVVQWQNGRLDTLSNYEFKGRYEKCLRGEE